MDEEIDQINADLLRLIDSYQAMLLSHRRFGQFDAIQNQQIIQKYVHLFKNGTISTLDEAIYRKKTRGEDYYSLHLMKELIMEYRTLFLMYIDVFAIQTRKLSMRIKNPSGGRVSAKEFLSLMFNPQTPHRDQLMINYESALDRLNPAYYKLINRFQQYAQEQHFESYMHMVDQSQFCNYQGLKSTCDIQLQLTKKPYFTSLTEMAKLLHVPLKKLSLLHMWDLFAGRSLPKINISGTTIVTLFDQTCHELGFTFKQNPKIDLDFQKRSQKSINAYCAIPTGDTNQKTVMVVYPLTSITTLATFFHEGGHAIHFTSIDESLPPIFRCIGDFATAETMAMLFEHLLTKARFLEDRLGLSSQDAQTMASFYKFLELYKFRKQCLNYLYLYDLLTDGFQLTLTQFEKYQYEIETRFHTLFGFERRCHDFLYSMDEKPLMVAHYIRAHLAVNKMVSILEENFGYRWWDQLAAGEMIRSRWMNYGFSIPFHELCRSLDASNG